MPKISQLATAQRVGLKRVRPGRCSFVKYRIGYAPHSRLASRPFLKPTVCRICSASWKWLCTASFYHLTQIGKSVWSRTMTLHGGNQQKVVLCWTSALAQRLELW
jgi:hypothetical protein